MNLAPMSTLSCADFELKSPQSSECSAVGLPAEWVALGRMLHSRANHCSPPVLTARPNMEFSTFKNDLEMQNGAGLETRSPES